VTSDGERQLRELLERARADDRILGALLFGSRAWGHALDEGSDHDVVVIAADQAALESVEHELPFERGAPVEVTSDTLAGLRAHAAIGSASEWARPAYAHARVLVDKTGGELGRIVAEKLVIPEEIRLERVRNELDTYVNAYHRSARNRTVGLERAARLDAAESIPPFLAAIFALEGRVRPFNKHLEWELRERPLRDEAWRPDELLPRLERILVGALPDQQILFRDVERVFRAGGFGDVLDGWEPDLAWLRGEAEYRRPHRTDPPGTRTREGGKP
jgi:predicted nucleotidyltransferase